LVGVVVTNGGFQSSIQSSGHRHNGRNLDRRSTRVRHNGYSCHSRYRSFDTRNGDRGCASSVRIDYTRAEPARCWRLPVFLPLWDSKGPQLQRRPRARLLPGWKGLSSYQTPWWLPVERSATAFRICPSSKRTPVNNNVRKKPKVPEARSRKGLTRRDGAWLCRGGTAFSPNTMKPR